LKLFKFCPQLSCEDVEMMRLGLKHTSIASIVQTLTYKTQKAPMPLARSFIFF